MFLSSPSTRAACASASAFRSERCAFRRAIPAAFLAGVTADGVKLASPIQRRKPWKPMSSSITPSPACRRRWATSSATDKNPVSSCSRASTARASSGWRSSPRTSRVTSAAEQPRRPAAEVLRMILEAERKGEELMVSFMITKEILTRLLSASNVDDGHARRGRAVARNAAPHGALPRGRHRRRPCACGDRGRAVGARRRRPGVVLDVELISRARSGSRCRSSRSVLPATRVFQLWGERLLP